MTTKDDIRRQTLKSIVEKELLELANIPSSNQTAHLREILPIIEKSVQVGTSLKAIHQKLLHVGFSFSYNSFTKALSRLRKKPPPRLPPLSHQVRREEAKPVPSSTNNEIPDFDKPGMTDKQRREALADYFCDPSQNLHPLIKKAMEKKK